MDQYVLTPKDSKESRIVTTETPDKSAWAVLCPWHQENTPSCVISPDKGIFYCFGCNTNGQCHRVDGPDNHALIQEYMGLDLQHMLHMPKGSINDEEWWGVYKHYLTTPEWRERRRRVMQRAGHMCEGCGIQRATQVHHLTYKRVGREMLFDLVAICDECHEAIHPD